MNKTLTVGGTVRAVIYIVGALLGLVALVLPIVGYPAAGAVIASVAAAAAAITGGTATYNLPKANDQAGVDVSVILPALLEVVGAVKEYTADKPKAVEVEAPPTADPAGATLEALRDMLTR